MAKLHYAVQGKGGAAKTTTAVMIAQYLAAHGKQPFCIDTDPVNASFHAYKALNVHLIKILEENEIDPRAWDTLIELLAHTKRDTVIDNGATSFVSLLDYMMSNDLSALLTSLGHEVYFHIPITGSEGMEHTIKTMCQIIDQFTSTYFVIWLHPFLGPIERKGKSFEELEEYLDRRDKIQAIIQMPKFPPKTFGQDLTYLLSNNLTFEEALEMKERPVKGGETERYSSLGLNIAVLQRLSIIRERIFASMAPSGVFL